MVFSSGLSRCFEWVRAIAWVILKTWVRRSFPTVEQLSTTTLAHQMEQGEPLLLIDARQPEEYAVSHLPGARRATSVDEVALMNPNQVAVVVYCSIGYRSARLVAQLKSLGYQAANLEGSLFQWANENRRLVVSDSQQTHRVHPYSPVWGLLINSADSSEV